MRILIASSDAELRQFRELVVEYENALPANLHHSGAQPEPGAIFLALEDGQPAGCVALIALDASTAVMRHLYVRAAFRNRGVARRLLAEFLKHARAQGLDRAVLDTDRVQLAPAYNLYRSLGFTECAPYGPVDYTSPTYMELPLTALVRMPQTHRMQWPGSTFARDVESVADVRLTLWLRAKSGGEIEFERARSIGATPPRRRAYANRADIKLQTGSDDADVEKVSAYCQAQGLAVVERHWRSVVVSGPLDRLVAAFGATVAVFADAGGEHFRGRTESLFVPHDIAHIVRGVFGFHQWPRSRRLGALQRHVTPLSASQVAERYAFPDADGSGQTIGIVQLRGEFRADDFDRCLQAQGLTCAQPVVKRVDAAELEHKIETTKDLEAALDAQIAASLAPGAQLVIYQAPDDERGFLDSIRMALFDEHLAPSVLSISYGWPECLWSPVALEILSDLFMLAAVLGVSIFCSSGDNGRELDLDGKPHVLAPASSPFAHACGATTISGDAQSGTESAWDRAGGGFSEQFESPPWQSAKTAAPTRGVPDVSAQESPGYSVYLNGMELAAGGTSAVAPMWSALAARINQRAGTPIGFFSPLLYASDAHVLREVGAPGWQPGTGLGVPDGSALEKLLTAP